MSIYHKVEAETVKEIKMRVRKTEGEIHSQQIMSTQNRLNRNG